LGLGFAGKGIVLRAIDGRNAVMRSNEDIAANTLTFILAVEKAGA
jgi:hypothetical protein